MVSPVPDYDSHYRTLVSHQQATKSSFRTHSLDSHLASKPGNKV
jgi:hypothetical protein